MPSLSDHLDDLRPLPVIRRFITELAATRSVRSGREGNYLSQRPAPIDSPIAVYVYVDRIELTFDPNRAKAVSSSIEGSRLKSLPNNAATAHVIIPDGHLESNYKKAMERAIQAVDWRATGVRRAQRDSVAKAERPKAAMCPKQFVPIGMCDCDDH